MTVRSIQILRTGISSGIPETQTSQTNQPSSDVFINTDDTTAAVQVAGYLTSSQSEQAYGKNLLDKSHASVYTTDGGQQQYQIDVNGGIVSLLLVSSMLLTFDVTVDAASLASAGTVTLFSGIAGKQYRVRNLYINAGGTDFSGGGGDRDAQITDGETDYSTLSDTVLAGISSTNAVWGSTDLPFPNPPGVPLNKPTTDGEDLYVEYEGGTTDYTAGSVVISGVLERIV